MQNCFCFCKEANQSHQSQKQWITANFSRRNPQNVSITSEFMVSHRHAKNDFLSNILEANHLFTVSRVGIFPYYIYKKYEYKRHRKKRSSWCMMMYVTSILSSQQVEAGESKDKRQQRLVTQESISCTASYCPLKGGSWVFSNHPAWFHAKGLAKAEVGSRSWKELGSTAFQIESTELLMMLTYINLLRPLRFYTNSNAYNKLAGSILRFYHAEYHWSGLNRARKKTPHTFKGKQGST